VTPAALGRLRHAVARSVRRTQHGVPILLYHRIADVECDPQLLCVSPCRFAEQLAVLADTYAVLRLSDVAAALRARRLPRRAVVVTFDDGYADNLEVAQPLLDAHALPATVFAATAYLGGREAYWWDRLERLLLRPGVLPGVLELRLGEDTAHWELGAAARYDEEAYRRHRSWNALSADDPTLRHVAYRELHRLLWRSGSSARNAALATLEANHEPLGHADEAPRALTADELVRLTAGKLIEVGAHTVTHPRLSGLAIAEQRAEIVASKQRLETILGRPVTGFAYPYGARGDYTPDTVQLVREAGFSCACTTAPAPVRRSSAPFELPRVVVRDWSGAEFASRLRDWFAA
jgi:peptidoglycan/xylan/chitin deacetylase (PgdA/CDA1 family)